MRSSRGQRRRAALLAVVAASLVGASGLSGQAAEGGEPSDTITAIAIDTVRVGGRIDDLIGVAVTSSEGRIGAEDLLRRPITREGELLETVPGVIVTQHSGEGKANQYFVRGFNLDHGTDFRTVVEGMPVNMPTHGHGQGYTDLNFLIPELVDLLEYRLGVYHAELGDFGSAGGTEMHLARRLDRPFVQATLGEHGFARLVAGGSRAVGAGDLLLGGEARLHDGPWELEQGVRKFSGMARYSWTVGDSRLSLLGLGYRNEWNATDQVPLRAVESGRIGRFGFVDPTDGGDSQRYSLSGSWRRITDVSSQEVQLYGIYSDLNLFSNFTYFLEDAAGGDQFKQKDERFVVGGEASYLRELTAGQVRHALTLGVQNRTDLIGDVGLFRSEARQLRSTVRQDEVVESGTGAYAELVSRWRPWIRTVLGMRGDLYAFDVESDLAANSGSETATIASPKASVVLTPSRDVELYVSGGWGFHSNDARGTVISVDPATGEAARPVDPLVRSRGAEVGARAALVPGLRSTLTLWALRLDSELLFVGDAGATEPLGQSTRSGVTWATYYRPLPALALDADLSFSRARLDEEPEGEDRIPGALERVVTAGAAWMPATGPFAAVRLRHFGEYPLIEDGSARADAATLLNAEVGYRFGDRLRLEVAALNLLDSEAADVQYFYESRLPGEAAPVEDVHFHPVEPRQLRATLHWGL